MSMWILLQRKVWIWMSKNEYVVTFDELDDILMDDYVDDLKTENKELRNENKKLKEELLSLQEELQAFYEMKLKDTSVRGTVWYLNDYDQEAIVVQTKLDSYMLIDKETYNRWYDEEFTKEEIIGELIKKGWRIKK